MEQDYIQLFCEHIIQLQTLKGLSKQELAAMGGVSGAFVTTLSQGTANPTLKTMQELANGLGVPLSILLKPSDSEEWQTVLALAGSPESGKKIPPEGYAYVRENVLLPLHKMYVLKQWVKDAKKQLAQSKRTLKK